MQHLNSVSNSMNDEFYISLDEAKRNYYNAMASGNTKDILTSRKILRDCLVRQKLINMLE